MAERQSLMIVKKKTLGIGVSAVVAVAVLLFVLVFLWGARTRTTLEENQSYVYAYVSEIQGNEITYMEFEESVVTTYLEQQENDGEMLGRPDGEMPSGERQSGDFGRMNTETTTTLIPVSVTVHTQSDTETTFQRLAAGDMIKMLVETKEDGEEVITEIWML